MTKQGYLIATLTAPAMFATVIGFALQPGSSRGLSDAPFPPGAVYMNDARRPLPGTASLEKHAPLTELWRFPRPVTIDGVLPKPQDDGVVPIVVIGW